ncbi:exported hypothetical protein [Actinacidiphila bryophytorum]|uniref:Uncharacterized protein n=1 Tax=Actinacidiphila bryophytorum TaxID=1436133 RepID=A0A9W4H412_9ACTN|nr:exported hypothetical protein [Actinacidiphila bryophytorum]
MPSCWVPCRTALVASSVTQSTTSSTARSRPARASRVKARTSLTDSGRDAKSLAALAPTVAFVLCCGAFSPVPVMGDAIGSLRVLEPATGPRAIRWTPTTLGKSAVGGPRGCTRLHDFSRGCRGRA